jgi:branched-chain amino acid transport system substrate-binding protein
MAISNITRRADLAALVGAAVFAASACAADTQGGTSSDTASGGSASAAPVKVGVVTSTSGLLASYGKMFTEGFKAGIDYATKGTGAAGGHKLDISYKDDATDPAKATAAVTSLVGSGTKIITGSVSSGVSAQVAPLAAQNKILYISGASAADAITGINKYTFRSGRQTYQDVVTSASLVGDIKGKKVVVYAQDYEFGQANVAAVTAVLGKAKGATVVPVLAPVQSTDFTPFSRKVLDAKPDLVFVAWAGDTSAAMWQSLEQQGVFDKTTVVTGLANRASFDSFGPAATKISFLAHYFAEASDNDPNKALRAAAKKDGNPDADIFHNDGFVAAQMVVHAVEQGGGDDVDKMVSSLEGWKFTGPKGDMTIRAEDHAMLQPMFTAKLTGTAGHYVPQLIKTLTPDETAPPAAAQ